MVLIALDLSDDTIMASAMQRFQHNINTHTFPEVSSCSLMYWKFLLDNQTPVVAPGLPGTTIFTAFIATINTKNSFESVITYYSYAP